MTKFEELEHMQYTLNLLGKLPADITIGTLYLHLEGTMQELKSSVTAKEAFTHQWYKYTKRISKRPPCATPGHAQDAP